MDTRQDDLRRDLDAALHARKELGKEYEPELVDSFLSRLDARLDARVERRVAERMDDYEPAHRRRPHRPGPGPGSSGTRLAVISLVLGIPLTAIAASPQSGGFVGLIVSWAGIVGVNFAAAFGNRRDRDEPRARSRSRDDWD
ncbi:hypothetical protein ACIPLC_22350 [Kitasatospora sp. NPDC086801]|uniref:hypothetical protein n=1 Tax=Kitasatospora sp. NPDC086801 TaxID=3364066 RepID=UPI00382E23A8